MRMMLRGLLRMKVADNDAVLSCGLKGAADPSAVWLLGSLPLFAPPELCPFNTEHPRK